MKNTLLDTKKEIEKVSSVVCITCICMKSYRRELRKIELGKKGKNISWVYGLMMNACNKKGKYVELLSFVTS